MKTKSKLVIRLQESTRLYFRRFQWDANNSVLTCRGPRNACTFLSRDNAEKTAANLRANGYLTAHVAVIEGGVS